MINGETRWANESMFLREIPGELKEETDRLSPGVRKAFRDMKRGGSEGHLYPWETGTSFGSGKGASAGSSYASPYGSPSGASSEAGRKRPAPAFGKQFQVVKADHLDYAEGDQVRHSRFGTGTVLRITEGGRDYAISTNAGASSTSSVLTTTVTVNSPSTLSFDYMAWGEGSATHWDACRFAVDGVVMFDEGALDNDWATFSTELQPGTHTLTWSYTKDGSVNPSGDYFAIDNVSLASALRGDVNGNGEVDINDVTMLIDVVLGKNVAYDAAAADCNIEGGNDNVDINDVTALINYVLRGTW
jgi:hypothetical protein